MPTLEDEFKVCQLSCGKCAVPNDIGLEYCGAGLNVDECAELGQWNCRRRDGCRWSAQGEVCRMIETDPQVVIDEGDGGNDANKCSDLGQWNCKRQDGCRWLASDVSCVMAGTDAPVDDNDANFCDSLGQWKCKQQGECTWYAGEERCGLPVLTNICDGLWKTKCQSNQNLCRWKGKARVCVNIDV
jgi:hypothetical protein